MLIRAAPAILVGLTVSTAALAQSDPCDSILANGTIAKTTIANNAYARTVFAARYSSQTYDEARRSGALSSILPVEGVSLKVGFSAEDWRKFQSEARQSVDVNQVNQSSTSIMRTFGDEVIVGGWIACMNGAGFHVRIRPGPTDSSALLEIKYVRVSDGDRYPVIDSLTSSGVIFLGARPVPGTRVARSGDYPVRLNAGVKGAIISLNLQKSQSRSVYLVRPIVFPPPGASCSPIPPSGDQGYPYSVLDIDLDKDGCIDHFHLVGNSGAEYMVFTSGEQSHAERTLYVGDGGYPDYMWWVENLRGDGKWAFCDVVGDPGAYNMQCRILDKNGAWDGPVLQLGSIDIGYKHTGVWQDLNNDGKKDFCRGVGSNPQDKRSCSYFDGTRFYRTDVN